MEEVVKAREIKYDPMLVRMLAYELRWIKPTPLSTPGQVFRTLCFKPGINRDKMLLSEYSDYENYYASRNIEEHLVVIAHQLIYGEESQQPMNGWVRISFGGFIEKHDHMQDISEIDLNALRASRWLEPQGQYLVSECMWFG